MTLIELMVVIVILVTLVAGVLPLVSPNNDSRKISDAARSMQTFFMQAQAEAARLGRPVGVGFRETDVDTGVALEAFQMVVPQPYPGSSTLSRVAVQPLPIPAAPGDPDYYGPTTYKDEDGKLVEVAVPRNSRLNKGKRFRDYFGAKLYAVHTRMALLDDNGNIVDDPLPPKMFQIGDIIEAQGSRFVIVDDPRNKLPYIGQTKDLYLDPASHDTPYLNTLICIRLEEVLEGNNAPPLAIPPGGYVYAIHRQPAGAERTQNSPKEQILVSGTPPLQLPAGVAVDLQASGLEGSQGGLFDDPPPPSDQTIENTRFVCIAGVMFSPNGGIDSVWVNGTRITDASRFFLLLGRVENGNPPMEAYTTIEEDMSDDDFRELQRQINWLNLDSRWLMVNGIDGRATVVPNASVDPRRDPALRPTREGETVLQHALRCRIAQIEAAHELAHHHN